MNEDMYKRYFLIWSFGEHHLMIETDSLNFRRVLKNMSKEFEILTKSIDSEFSDQTETYYFINYWGVEEIVGHIFYYKQKREMMIYNEDN